ncbi:MAG: hypothetical protein WAV21_02025 [Minisyncoccia bacterium]
MVDTNIVQAEFFGAESHPGDSRIKTVVRFFDDDNSVTKLIVKLGHRQQKGWTLFYALFESKGIRHLVFRIRYRLFSFFFPDLSQKQLAAFIAKRFKKAAERSTVAIQCRDYSFRGVQKEELQKLTKSVCGAKGVWILVHRPNDLMSDSNRTLYYLMYGL